jgi:hypothetical protein
MPTPADTARTAERKDEDADPFPPEGTDEKVVRSDDVGPLTQEEAVRATRKAVGKKA